MDDLSSSLYNPPWKDRSAVFHSDHTSSSYAIAASSSWAVVGGSGCVSWRIDSALK